MRLALGRLVFVRGLSTRPPPLGVKLRDYQEDALQACTNALASGESPIAVSLPTGSGKTVVFLTLLLSRITPPTANPDATRSLVIVNSVELARQTVLQARKLFPHLHIAVDQGSKRASPHADLTVATYQSLVKPDRLSAYDPRTLKAIVVDEAHHATSSSYRRILSNFHPNVDSVGTGTLVRPHISIPIIGFSATWSRLDGVGLASVFERMVYHLEFLDMIKAGWLCNMRFTVARGNLNLNTIPVSKRSGDFISNSLARTMNTPEMNQLVVDTWLKRAANRKSTLVFCVNVEHLKALTSAFRVAGVDAEYIHSGMSTEKRQELLDAFRNGQIPVLLNVLILTEGADIPNIDCIMLARPTQSHALFRQMLGRGTRQSHETGKKDCHIIDFADTADRARGVVSISSLFGIDLAEVIEGVPIMVAANPIFTAYILLDKSAEELSERETGQSPKRQISNAIRPQSLNFAEYDNTISFARAVSIVRRYSSLAWVDCGDDLYVLSCMDSGYVHVQAVRTSEGAFGSALVCSLPRI
ncbi:uncharacterized protein PHACADRAFT_99640 [Phanerochaete carnosa HHB-10118-sp]|uniref:P-loop containing nucleoside triphosphate hydrolase protein n=1 Tax=Phanerochaete carnosa (strain HHB-10118-sp) TaxID=650164 RepID=K5W3Q0_PHACS|nr:uncharacterized protein PHACADRAFT_99640 [Phanerochaete carnosa HHB-10118-sp]EKM53554.1 hypothetical protein PHACADRAFT_99640 [Phanerochaete carnosa HHB-10118-sp]